MNAAVDLSAAENPGAAFGDVAKAVAELWRGLSEDDKKPFQVQSVLQHPLRRRVFLPFATEMLLPHARHTYSLHHESGLL